MSIPEQVHDEVRRLLWTVREGDLNPDEAARLQAMLADDSEVRELYVVYSYLCGSLEWDHSARRNEVSDQGSGGGVQGSEAGVHPLSFILNPLTALAGNVVFSYALCALLLGAGVTGALVWRSPKERPFARESAERGPNLDAPRPGPVGRVTKAINCRWANPATGPQDAARGKIDLADGMFEITYESGATVTTLGGRVTLVVDSADSVAVSRGLVVVMTPPISGRVAACMGSLGPCIVAAPPVSAGRADPRRQSSSTPAAPPPAGARRLFRIRTPAMTVIERSAAAFCVLVQSAATTAAHVYCGQVDLQVMPARNEPPRAVPLGAGGWVYTGLKPDGGRLIVFCTEDTVPSSLARRLPNLTFPTYSQQIGPKAPGQKANPGS